MLSSSSNGQGRPLFDVVYPAFPLPTTASPTVQGALKDVVGEAVVACDMPEPCDDSEMRLLYPLFRSAGWGRRSSNTVFQFSPRANRSNTHNFNSSMSRHVVYQLL